MSLPEPATAMLSTLAQALGLSALDLDAEGLRSLALNDQLVVHLQADPAANQLVLFAVVATLPLQPPAETLTRLLHANRFWRGSGGATLSLDEQTPPRVILARQANWLSTTPAEFVALFEQFADQLSDWSDTLNDRGHGDTSTSAPASTGFPPGDYPAFPPGLGRFA